jgi:hypothetical protein
MKVSEWGGRLGLCCLLALSFSSGCREDRPSTFDRNLPPETVITGAPAESALAYYQVHLKWYGVDPDGVIDHYEYSVTDSNKTPGEDDPGFTGYYQTTRTDSVFLLTANDPQILGHRFYVRSVDNEGKTDPTPAWTYFVAHDFNFPRVVFTSAVGRWIDRQGRPQEVPIASSSRFAPTDTIGVGGSVTVSWTGFDDDIPCCPGIGSGRVVGYEFRRSNDPEFLGGTPADTIATMSFAEAAGEDITAYYSGTAAILVRAIDDAGARTNPDSARSVVVNFSPRAWIVHPDSTVPPAKARTPVFIEKDSQTIYPSGTVLADGLRRIQFKFSGRDDDRDMSLDPNNPSGVVGFQFRRLKNGGGFAFQDIQTWKRYPQVSDFDDGADLTSGDYAYLIRARDELGREGLPAILEVSVNYSPYFEWVRYVDQDTVEQSLWNPGPSGQQLDTVQVVIPELQGGGYPDFRVRFVARDDHDPMNPHPLDFNPLVEEELSFVQAYRIALNNALQGFSIAPTDSAGLPTVDERVYPVSPLGGASVVSEGLNVLELTVRDLGSRFATVTVVFDVVLQ